MHYGRIIDRDIANGAGVRVSLFVSGCTNHCDGCFQPQTWDFNYGEPFTEETEDQIIEMLSKPYIDGLTLLGGEPFEPANQPTLVHLLRRVRAELPEKNVWCYTGFNIEDLGDNNAYCHGDDTMDMLSLIDVLVDGRFIEDLKDISLSFRGSRNQRVIDLNRTTAYETDYGYGFLVVLHDVHAEEFFEMLEKSQVDMEGIK